MKGLCTIYESDENRRRTPKEKVKIEQNQQQFGFHPIPISKTEAKLFLVSEETKNKPHLP